VRRLHPQADESLLRALRDAGVEAVPMEAFAVWTAKMRPEIQ
jgi:hypothetical protein